MMKKKNNQCDFRNGRDAFLIRRLIKIKKINKRKRDEKYRRYFLKRVSRIYFDELIFGRSRRRRKREKVKKNIQPREIKIKK